MGSNLPWAAVATLRSMMGTACMWLEVEDWLGTHNGPARLATLPHRLVLMPHILNLHTARILSPRKALTLVH